jgi:LEA14-like dessication related protein
VTSSTTTIDAAIGINNRLPFGIGAGSIGVKVPVYINDVRAAQLDVPGLSLPKGLSNLQASATLVQANLPEWWSAFVQQGEKLSVRVQPQASARVAGLTFLTSLPDIQTEVPVPIMSNMHSTGPVTMGFDNATPLQIAQGPLEHFVASPPSPSPARPVLTVESWNLRWGDVTGESSQVLGTLVLRNELPVPIPIQGLRIGLDMNGIRVVPDVDLTPARAELPSGQSVPLALEANVDNGKLVE